MSQHYSYLFDNKSVAFDALLGKIVAKITQHDDTDIIFYTNSGKYHMCHIQDCCEGVFVDDIIGDLDDLINSPVIMAEEASNSNEHSYGSETWTFYKLATTKGYVTIKWHGSSNGYYSEHVDFLQCDNTNYFLAN